MNGPLVFSFLKVRFSSLNVVDKKISKNGEIVHFKTIQYWIPGTVDIKIHEDSAISLYKKGTLKNRHDEWDDGRETKAPELEAKHGRCFAIKCETFDTKNETFDEVKESDDILLYIESEEQGKIIIGTNENFKTVSIDASGGLYKLKKTESFVAKTKKKLLGNKFVSS